MIKLAPSILSADFGDLREQVKIIDNAGCDYIHIDVMDGHFVPNITIGPDVIKSLRDCTKKTFDVHLMISNPDKYIDKFAQAGADIITVHSEACVHIHKTIQSIKQKGLKAAVALNPGTPISVLDCILDDLDMVLIMTVNPGFGGQKFIDSTLNKIKQLKNMIEDRKLNTEIEVDGGINLSTVNKILDAGANVVVAGSAVYNTPDCKAAIADFKKIFNNYR